jgi:transcriptional regulator with XRE-family HTH domain
MPQPVKLEPRQTFGPLLREWRAARQVSQLDLALSAGASVRHLSFVETGRATPSRDFVLRLAEALDLPLRARNNLLIAAGYAPMFRESALAEPPMASIRTALDSILQQQEPYPALVLDLGWNVVMRNTASLRMRRAFIDDESSAAAGSAARNAMKLIFDPLLYRPYVVGWKETAEQILLRLRHEATTRNSPAGRLVDELLAYPGVPQINIAAPALPNEPLMTVTLVKGMLRIKYFSTISTFGTPQDITLQELRIKCFFPADPDTAAVFRCFAAEDPDGTGAKTCSSSTRSNRERRRA